MSDLELDKSTEEKLRQNLEELDQMAEDTGSEEYHQDEERNDKSSSSTPRKSEREREREPESGRELTGSHASNQQANSSHKNTPSPHDKESSSEESRGNQYQNENSRAEISHSSSQHQAPPQEPIVNTNQDDPYDSQNPKQFNLIDLIPAMSNQRNPTSTNVPDSTQSPKQNGNKENIFQNASPSQIPQALV
jgi:hypothetical protein